jgi:hypothetical protein
MGARGVLLVEGVTDVQAVVQLLRKLKKDAEIVVLPVGGRELIKAGTGREIDELRRLGTSVHVLIDSESNSEGAALSAQRQNFVAECASLKIDIHVLKRRALENYWAERAIRAAVGASARSLGDYETLQSSKAGWSKSDNGRIAAEITLDELRSSDLLEFLDAL